MGTSVRRIENVPTRLCSSHTRFNKYYYWILSRANDVLDLFKVFVYSVFFVWMITRFVEVK